MSATRALEDIKICDLMWVMAGPAATRVLADFGATVVRIESAARPDPARGVSPHLCDSPRPDSSVLWNNNNAGKLGLSLDLSKPSGREVFKDLVRWADVVAESFSPGTMEQWGLDYSSLARINPRIIVVSTCLMGQTGPHAGLAGFGNLSAGITGFYGLCGWPDRPPSGPFGAYTDYIAPRYVAIAILAALEYRHRTGQGQYVDLAQAEAALHFLTPALLEQGTRGTAPEALDNFDITFAPHGVYPTRTPDVWIAIVCTRDAEWNQLCKLVDLPHMPSDPRFVTVKNRVANRTALDAQIASWTSSQEPAELEARLLELRIPANIVQDSEMCKADPQLAHRRHFVTVSHSTLGDVVVEGPRFNLSRTPGGVQSAAPIIGEHDEFVLAEILGYDAARRNELRSDGAMSPSA